MKTDPEKLPLAVRNLQRLWRLKQQEMKITQTQAGKKLGWTQGALSHYLMNRSELNPQAVIKLANFLDVDPLEIDPDIAPFLPNVQQINIIYDGKDATRKLESAVYIKDQALTNVTLTTRTIVEQPHPDDVLYLLYDPCFPMRCLVSICKVDENPKPKLFAARLKSEKQIRFYWAKDRPEASSIHTLWSVVSVTYI